jgi:hypothetical protein
MADYYSKMMESFMLKELPFYCSSVAELIECYMEKSSILSNNSSLENYVKSKSMSDTELFQFQICDLNSIQF